MYRNVLVAVDDSEMADAVLEHAFAIASAFNARLTILSVAPPVPTFAYAPGVDVGALEQQSVQVAERRVRTAAAAAPGRVGVTTVVRTGNPGREIVEQIESGDHDLVVLGSRGRGRVASGVLGSVAGDVHFGAHVPLLIVHP